MPGMTQNHAAHILIAEDNEVSRELMASVLRTQGFSVLGAAHADEAIEVINAHDVDLALVDINMAPRGGFDFIKYLVANGIDLPVVIVTADVSSDVLMHANAHGVRRVLQKPTEPDLLLQVVRRILKGSGRVSQPLAVDVHKVTLNDEELMTRAITLAERNARSGAGGPFGAVVTDAQGRILGEGVNGISARVDPTAHAEVMAIRQAAEKLGRADLSDCRLYCSGEPTMMGQALILSVGIQTVFYGLSHDEIRSIRARENKVRETMGRQVPAANYTQLGHDSALKVFMDWQALKQKVAD